VHEEAELENNSKTEKIDPGRQRWTKQPEKYRIQEEYMKSANIRGLNAYALRKENYGNTQNFCGFNL
jgi:hypothetical protein